MDKEKLRDIADRNSRGWINTHDVVDLLAEVRRLNLAEAVADAALRQSLTEAEADRLGRVMCIDGTYESDKKKIAAHRQALSELGDATSAFLAALERYRRAGKPLAEESTR